MYVPIALPCLALQARVLTIVSSSEVTPGPVGRLQLIVLGALVIIGRRVEHAHVVLHLFESQEAISVVIGLHHCIFNSRKQFLDTLHRAAWSS